MRVRALQWAAVLVLLLIAGAGVLRDWSGEAEEIRRVKSAPFCAGHTVGEFFAGFLTNPRWSVSGGVPREVRVEGWNRSVPEPLSLPDGAGGVRSVAVLWGLFSAQAVFQADDAHGGLVPGYAAFQLQYRYGKQAPGYDPATAHIVPEGPAAYGYYRELLCGKDTPQRNAGQ